MRGSWDSESHAVAASESAHHSVGAGVRRAVWRVIRATVVVKAAASEMTSSVAKVTSADAGHATSAKTSHVSSAEVTSAEATHVASAKAAHMAAATAATATSVSAATATAGLCISGKKAAGKHCTCQNHHHSSSHGILLWNGRDFFRHRTGRWRADANVAMD